jgi:hypothetical protein
MIQTEACTPFSLVVFIEQLAQIPCGHPTEVNISFDRLPCSIVRAIANFTHN